MFTEKEIEIQVAETAIADAVVLNSVGRNTLLTLVILARHNGHDSHLEKGKQITFN